MKKGFGRGGRMHCVGMRILFVCGLLMLPHQPLEAQSLTGFPTEARELLVEGRGAEIEQRQDDAIEAYARALKVPGLTDEQKSEILNHSGSFKASLRDYRGAIVEYSSSLELQPSYGAAWFNRGIANYALEFYSEAIEDLTKAIALMPGSAAALAARGDAFRKMGQDEEAEKDYLDSARLRPSGSIYLRLGILEAQRSNYHEAVDYYTKGTVSGESDWGLYYNRANAHYSLKSLTRKELSDLSGL